MPILLKAFWGAFLVYVPLSCGGVSTAPPVPGGSGSPGKVTGSQATDTSTAAQTGSVQDAAGGQPLNASATGTPVSGPGSPASSRCEKDCDTTPPIFAGIKSAEAISPTEVFLTWEPASDDQTPQSEIEYAVCVSLKPGVCSGSKLNFLGSFVPSITLGVIGTTFVRGTSRKLWVLNPGTTYYFAVRAIDKANNWDSNTVEISVTTLPAPDEDEDGYPPPPGLDMGGGSLRGQLEYGSGASTSGLEPSKLDPTKAGECYRGNH